jgi:hypothetical protein
MLRSWWGGTKASVAVRDDRGGGCAITLLGRRSYRGVRAMAGVGRRTWCCRRRAAVKELTMTTRTVDIVTRGEGQMMTRSSKNGSWKMQGDNNGGDDGGGEHWMA